MRESMEIYPRTAAERAMKLQEVLLRATAGKIKWWQAAELIGISERQMRRWRKRLEEQGPSPQTLLPEQTKILLTRFASEFGSLGVVFRANHRQSQ
jgi:hypothetical protein